MSRPWPRPLRGIVPPMVTPLSGPDELDVPGLSRLVDRLIEGGVAGLFVLGSCGEGPALSGRLRRDLVERTCTLVDGRVPVLVGVTDPSLVEALAMARDVAKLGADGVVASAPYYFKCTQTELASYFKAIADQSPLPLFLYNMPGLTKTWVGMESVRAGLAHENVVGLKDSSGDMNYAHEVLLAMESRPDWAFWVGPEHLTAEATLMGGHGGVNGGALIDPRLFVDLYNAAASGDLVKVRELHRRAMRLSPIYRFGEEMGGVVRGLKAALESLGICSGLPAAPFAPISDDERARMRALLKELGR